MGLTISIPPGFADLADSALVANSPAFAINLAKIYSNSVFGMTRPEVFVTGPYQNGDTVTLPKSPIDGYVYSRNELIYMWTVQNSVDKSTGWITGADSLWFCNWLVDQSTGVVSCFEWYRRSGSHFDGVRTNDGTLTVFTIAQRQNGNLIVSSSPTYAAISSTIAQDKPLTQLLVQSMNDDAKFSCLNREVFYLGEYHNGQTVTMPHSPADGYAYSAGECSFMFSLRWTPDGTLSHLTSPPLSYGQLGPILASVNSSGVVSTTIKYIDNSGNLNSVNEGRIAVFAFCKRSGTPGSISPAALNFSEISYDEFMPGSFIPFGTVQQIINNILESLLATEVFGPTTHQDGDTISVPTSTVDGHVYSRSDLTYIWAFSDTTNAAGSNLRMASFGGDIHQNTGIVQLYGYRLPPGSDYTAEDTTKPRISVITFARRNAALQTNPGASSTTPGATVTSGGGSGTDVPTLSVPQEDVFSGDGSTVAFTLTGTPQAGFVMCFWNGERRRDFSVSSGVATTSFTADTGDTVSFLYFT